MLRRAAEKLVVHKPRQGLQVGGVLAPHQHEHGDEQQHKRAAQKPGGSAGHQKFSVTEPKTESGAPVW